MIQCRACLKFCDNIQMISFDEKILLNYNLLTNLEMQLCDVVGKQLCGCCYKMINLFVEFRNRCLKANSVFLSYDFCEEDVKVVDKEKANCKSIINYIIKTEKENDIDDSPSDLQIAKEIDENYELELSEIFVKLEDTEEKVSLQLKNQNNRSISNLAEIFACGICARSFDDRSLMSNHLDTHKNSNDLTCLLCSEKFTDWPQLFSHRLKHVPNKQKLCHVCFKRFKSSLSLEIHYKNIHSNESFLSYCKFCNKSYKTPIRLQKHILGFHSNKVFICDFCSKVWNNKQLLKLHMRVHMDNKPYVCDQCEFSCKYISNLKIHKIVKHNPTKIYCKDCSRVFGVKSEFDQHKCSKKMCMCSICGKTFIGIKALKRHMISHEAEGRHRCARCPAVYKSACALRAHRDRHDGVRSKRCEFCPMSFVSGSTLTKHRRTHTGVKPYVCKICQKAFTGNNNLKVHMRVHGEYLVKKRDKNVSSTQTK